MSSDWGPPGLETPTSYVGVLRVGAFVAVLAIAIGARECERHFDRTNPMTGDRTCADKPSEIAVWSFNHHDRRPEEAANLEKWVARHADRINKQYGATCETPLHFAAQFGRDELAELLIAAGADVEALDEYDHRPLHAAAAGGRPAVVKLLLQHGADVHARGSDGQTPLHAAASAIGDSYTEARLEVATLLLAAGADVNARGRSGDSTPLRCVSPSGPGSKAMKALLVSYGADPGGGGSQGPPLFNVAVMGNLEGMQLLLDRGADANAAGIDTTALGGAAYGGHVDAVRLLLDAGAVVDRRVRGSRLEWDGLPLAMALVIARTRESDGDAMNRRRDAARLLLRRGADPNARTRSGETLVHRTASEGDAAALDLLLSHAGKADARDAAGFTPLHAAVRHGRIEAAKRLLAAGASPHARASDGRTPLDLASGDIEITPLLRAGR